MSRHVAEAFALAKSENRAALIGYLPAGFPNPDLSVRLINAMVAAGVDIIEVGLPYSDPLMDGPVIQQAVNEALSAGTTTDVVIDIVRQVVDAGAIAVVMSYWNPIERYGVQKFAEGLQAAGECCRRGTGLTSLFWKGEVRCHAIVATARPDALPRNVMY